MIEESNDLRLLMGRVLERSENLERQLLKLYKDMDKTVDMERFILLQKDMQRLELTYKEWYDDYEKLKDKINKKEGIDEALEKKEDKDYQKSDRKLERSLKIWRIVGVILGAVLTIIIIYNTINK